MNPLILKPLRFYSRRVAPVVWCNIAENQILNDNFHETFSKHPKLRSKSYRTPSFQEAVRPDPENPRNISFRISRYLFWESKCSPGTSGGRFSSSWLCYAIFYRFRFFTPTPALCICTPMSSPALALLEWFVFHGWAAVRGALMGSHWINEEVGGVGRHCSSRRRRLKYGDSLWEAKVWLAWGNLRLVLVILFPEGLRLCHPPQ